MAAAIPQSKKINTEGKTMIWYILLAVAAVIGIIAIIASTKPDGYTIQRQSAIPGLPEDVFPYVNDLQKFQKWSPWARLDPNMKVTHGEPAYGSGANFSWEGNSKVGAGKMTITESRPNELVRSRLDFYKPWSCTNTHEFLLKPDGSQTVVTWTMKGKAPFFFKMIIVFASADSMMGKDFELGLVTLKAIAAGSAAGVGRR